MTLTERGHKLDKSPSAISCWIAVSLKNIDMLIAEDVALNEIEKLRLDPSLIVDEVGTHDTEYMDAIEHNISAIEVQLDKLIDLYLGGSLSRYKIDTRQRELTEAI